MRQRHALYAFPALPQYASMVRTQNQVGSNPLDLLAGCTRVVAGCHQKKHYNAPFLRQRTTSEAYEGVRKGSACRSHCCRPFNPCLLCAAGIPRRSGTGKHECLGATLRLWLLAASVALLCLGFVQLYFKKSACNRRSTVSLVLFWIAVAVVVLVILFPQVIASVVAG